MGTGGIELVTVVMARQKLRAVLCNCRQKVPLVSYRPECNICGRSNSPEKMKSCPDAKVDTERTTIKIRSQHKAFAGYLKRTFGNAASRYPMII